MGKINLVDSHKGVAWNGHLQWILDNRGVLAWLLFEGEQLVEYLNSYVAHRVEYKGAILAKGIPLEGFHEHLSAALLSQFSSHEKTTVTEEQRQEIMEFVQNLESNTVSVEV